MVRGAKETVNNRRVLEKYCQADVTVLRQACQVFRREFMQIGQVEVSLESVTIATHASVATSVLENRYDRPDPSRRVQWQHELQQEGNHVPDLHRTGG
jgi:hypothetical protein